MRVAVEAEAILAESPVWLPIEEKLYWVDIENCELHRYNPKTGKDISLGVGQRIGAVVLTKNGGILAGLENCIAKVDIISGSIIPVLDLEQNILDNRCNDGKCDPSGRLWIGTMDLDGKKGAGSLYRINCDYQVTRVLTNTSISNGIAWSPDLKKMYYIDSPTYRILAFDYDDKTGNISNPSPVIEVPEEIGLPDGMTIDEKGMLWIAHWGGSQVCRWNPANGELLGKLKVPAPNVTSCIFGGPFMSTLFITTARSGLSDKELKKYPMSGSLFATQVDVKGLNANYFQE